MADSLGRTNTTPPTTLHRVDPHPEGDLRRCRRRRRSRCRPLPRERRAVRLEPDRRALHRPALPRRRAASDYRGSVNVEPCWTYKIVPRMLTTWQGFAWAKRCRHPELHPDEAGKATVERSFPPDDPIAHREVALVAATCRRFGGRHTHRASALRWRLPLVSRLIERAHLERYVRMQACVCPWRCRLCSISSRSRSRSRRSAVASARTRSPAQRPRLPPSFRHRRREIGSRARQSSSCGLQSTWYQGCRPVRDAEVGSSNLRRWRRGLHASRQLIRPHRPSSGGTLLAQAGLSGDPGALASLPSTTPGAASRTHKAQDCLW